MNKALANAVKKVEAELVTVNDLAAALGRTSFTIRMYLQQDQHEIEHIKLFGAVLFPKTEVTRLQKLLGTAPKRGRRAKGVSKAKKARVTDFPEAPKGYDSMTLAQLREEATKRGVGKSGTKAAIIKRLNDYDKQSKTMSYEDLERKDLIQIAKERGIGSTGSKATLVTRLKKHDAKEASAAKKPTSRGRKPTAPKKPTKPTTRSRKAPTTPKKPTKPTSRKKTTTTKKTTAKKAPDGVPTLDDLLAG